MYEEKLGRQGEPHQAEDEAIPEVLVLKLHI